MIVYRYMSEQEFDLVIKNQFKNIGCKRAGTQSANTFKYGGNQNYMHFFLRLKDFPIVRKIHKSNKNMILCKFDIPVKTLIKYAGKGFYEASGYDMWYDTVREFAIPSEKLSIKNFESKVVDKQGLLTVEDAKTMFKMQQRQKRLLQEQNYNEK